jgi:predicted double-glycine peptidase
MRFHDGELLYTPLVSQLRDYTCGVAVVRSVFKAHGRVESEADLLAPLGASEDTGVSYRMIERLARAKGYSCDHREGMTVGEVKETIRGGVPVIVMLQAWGNRRMETYRRSKKDGHFAIATGFNEDHLFFMDPSTPRTYTHIPTDEFDRRWRDLDYFETSPGKRTVEVVTNFGLTMRRAGVFFALHRVRDRLMPKMS